MVGLGSELFELFGEPMAYLTWRDSSGVDHEIELAETLTIGRSTDGRTSYDGAHLAVGDPHVSRMHARVDRTFRGFELHDAGSSNGTRLNATRLDSYHVLTDGDVIGIGGTILTYRRDRVQGVAIVSTPSVAAASARVRSSNTAEFPLASDFSSIDELKRAYEQLRTANQLNRAIVADLDPNSVLERIIETAISMFNADRGVILLHNPRNDEYEVSVVRHRDPARSNQVVTISRTVLREVVEERSALISTDASIDSRLSGAHSLMLQGIRSTMSVPMISDDRVRGVMLLDSSRSLSAFSEADLSLLQDFASHATRALHLAELAEARSQQTIAQQRLERLLPASIVADVMKGKADLVRGGDLREATVLFCDIRGFTSMSESLGPREVVEILNEYFELMVEQIFAFEGALDKFIGDEIMAVWGAHIPVEDHAYKAVQAAIRMQEAIARLNELRVQRKLRTISAGVGINTGQLVAGYMGSNRAMNYTVIGDTVNVAARLCSAAGADEIVISDAVAEALNGRIPLEPLPAQTLKGKSQTVELFRVLRQVAD